MRHRSLSVLMILALALPFPVHAADAPGAAHAVAHDGLVPVEGDPGAFTVATPNGTRVVRAAVPSGAVAIDRTVNLTGFRFDADGSAATQIDTIEITVGQTVRFHRVDGTHTVTSGEDSADPASGALFDAAVTLSTPNFDFTFTQEGTFPYYCTLHELFNMKGVVVVMPAAGVESGVPVARTGFARPPAPNPARGPVAFSIALVRGGAVTVEVIDAAGRRVATVQRGTLPAGEHAFRWDGTGSDGRAAAAGMYRLRLRAGDTEESRAFSLLR